MAYTDVQVPSLSDPGLFRDDSTNFVELLTQMNEARDNLIREFKKPNKNSTIEKRLVGYHLEMINIILKNSAITEILDIYKQLHIDYKTSYMAIGESLTGLLTLEDDKDRTKLRIISTLFSTATNAVDIRQNIDIDVLSSLIDGDSSIIEVEDSNAVISDLVNYLNS